MKSVFLVILLSLLIIFASFKGNRGYKYKYVGGWATFQNNTAVNLARGVNDGYFNALNYAYADNLYDYIGIYYDQLNEDDCKNYECSPAFDNICNNADFFFDQNNVETCVLYYNTTPYITVYNDQNFYYTFDQCSSLCDNTPKCNLFEYLQPLNPDWNNSTQCNLFHLFENATVNDAIQIDTSCGDTCPDAWYVRANMCKSVSGAVPDSYCKAYCLYNDAKNSDICTGVKPNMKSICECNNVVNYNYCHSLSASVPDAYCKPYCHINGTTCTVDQHMSSICSCSL